MRLGLGSSWDGSQPSPCPCASLPRSCRPWSALSSLLSLSCLHPPVLSPRSASHHSCRCPTLPAVLNPGCQGRCGATLAWLSPLPSAQGRSHWAVLPQACVLRVSHAPVFLSSSVTFIASCVLPSAPPRRSVRPSLSSLGTLIPTGATLKVRRYFPFVCPHWLPALGPTGHV